MYSVYVLDREALKGFRDEFSWLSLPADIVEVSLYLDDLGQPTRLTALAVDANGHAIAASLDTLGVETILALIRYAPRGISGVEDCPDEAEIRAILEKLPHGDGTRPVAEVEAERRSLLSDGYKLIRDICEQKFGAAKQMAATVAEQDRIERLLQSVPPLLTNVTETHKSLFLEADLWRLVAVMRDEYSLPADYDLGVVSPVEGSDDHARALLEVAAMSDPIIQAMFDLSPVAFSISTIGQKNSRYVRVNQTYLDLIGKSWEDIGGSEMVSSGVVLGGDDRRGERLALLDGEGGYSGERAVLRNAQGQLVPVVISARRLFLGGQFYDFEVLVPENGD